MDDSNTSTTNENTVGPFDRTIMDALSAHIALLDEHGVILDTNHAWRRYGERNGVRCQSDMIRMNYLEICEQTRGADESNSKKAAAGIRRVIQGMSGEFTLEYPCHTPTERMWFYMRANPIHNKSPYKVIISHENITDLKLAEEEIKIKEAELYEKTVHLEETNTALKVLLRQRETDKDELSEKVLANVEQLAFPYIDKLKSTRLNDRQVTYLDILESNLKEIISPFLVTASRLNNRLTPQEIKVAHLVKSGRTSKDIADILHISVNAVDFHRKHIRSKLGLRHSKTNLQSYLLSMK